MALKSNGFGSYLTQIIWRVQAPHFSLAEKEAGRPPFRFSGETLETSEHADFLLEIPMKNLKDGETIDYMVACSTDVPNDCWSILWRESEY